MDPRLIILSENEQMALMQAQNAKKVPVPKKLGKKKDKVIRLDKLIEHLLIIK